MTKPFGSNHVVRSDVSTHMRIMLACCLALLGAACTSSTGQKAAGASASSILDRGSAEAAGDDAIRTGAEAGAEVGTDESSPAALSPAEARAQLSALAEASGATHLVARGVGGRYADTWVDDSNARVESTDVLAASGRDPAAFELFLSWADENYLYWVAQPVGGSDGSSQSGIATDYQGTVVCAVGDIIHHVTLRADGTYVAAVERWPSVDDAVSPEGGAARPAFAVDCATAEEQPIEPFVIDEGDGATRITDRIGGKTFTFLGDAEGNADLLNEAGLVVNDGDYAGSHAFDRRGERVVYGDYGQGDGALLTRHLVARTTTDATVLWRKELDDLMTFLAWTDETVLVTVAQPLADPASLSTVEALILDQDDGTVVEQISTTLDLRHAD